MGLRNRQVLKTQLRALLRASKYGNLKIMFPLISGLSELRQAKAVLEETKAELTDVDCSNIKLGCMIELPSAVFVADLLAEEVDFFSIGTNDLIQYSIAIDRSNEHVAYLYTPYHPSILRAIKMVLDAGKKAGIEVSMCGNLASEMNMAPILVGMGLRSFSMSPVSIPFIKAAIRSVSAKEAEELCDRVLKMKTSLEIEDAAFQFMKDKINIDVNDV